MALSQESIDALVTKVEGGAANVQDIYPLAPLQEGILFHHLMSGESDPYVLSGVLAFRGREVMERFVRATLPVSVVELDAGEGDIVRQLEARFDSRGYRMDVSRAPLMHVHAACDGEHERWVARVLFHHLSIDHTTLERVIEEARAIGQGRVEDLPRPAPFRNFVAQARLGVSEADHEAYFRAKLGDIDEPTAPFGLLSVQGDGREIAEAARTLKPELSGALRGHARRLGVSAASMMHVAWGLVLSRTTGRQDVVFGTVLFGRMQGGAQSDRALGLFINTLPVRMKVAQTGVEASVKETHAQLAELMRHEHAPLVLAQRCSGVPAQTPLFTSLLNYRYGLRHRADAATPGGDDIELLSARERTNYPLTLSVDDLGQDFSLTVQVSGHVDPQRVCAFMETALEQLAQALGEQPQCDIGGLDVLPRSEREQMVYAWNATERDYPIEQCIHQLFEAQVDRKPEAIALTFEGQRLSYAELNARANRLAHYLQARGVGPDRLVALCAERGIEMVVGLLAILKAGGAYVPLDPAYASDRLRGIVQDSQPALVLADAVGRAALGELDGALPVIDLETDALRWREMPATNPELKPELSGALRGHARRLGVSAASMMHVAWGLVLSRTTGRQDVVFGTVLFGRMQGGAQSDRALGLFINTLPVRMRVAQTGVEASVKGTHAQLAELMRHEHAPLVLAQRCSGVPAQTPLFTSLLNYRYSKPKVAAAHIADGIELLDGHERTSYPLSVTVDDHERDFTIVAKVCERIGPQRVCELMELALEQLTRALSANPGGELAELDVLPAAERTQVLHGWNETGRAYARDACLHQLFEAQVSRTPEAAAVICGDETLSYTDLDARANRLAHYLRGQGVGPDTRVGLALGRGVEMMTGLLAILKAGGAYVPLDPGYASERLRAILDDSRPAIVLADAAGRAALDALAGAPPIADLHADASRWSALPSTPPRVEGLTPRHLAYVIYTSGSTGQPKGVMVEHASVVNLWRALDEAIYRTHPSARRVSLNASIAFDSLVKQWVQLLSGRTLVVVPEPVRFDGRRLLDAIGRDRIDVFDCTPSQLALIEGARGPEDEAYPQVTLVGGEAIGEGMWSELASASSRTYYNVYGPTECTVDATLARIKAEHAPHIGGPLANVRAYVLNERLSPAPVGVRGELYIGGAGVARGYLNRPELTRERFIDDPFVAGGRLYRTGDLARWRTDGRLEYLGRNDFQVKIRGFRIELGEIEAQLAKVAGVREVVVLARDSAAAVRDSATEHAAPDAPSPETATATEKRLVAYYKGDADVAALRAQAAQHLPSYMVPSAYVRPDAWPLTPNGKLDRRALPAPADDAYARAEYEAPQGAREEALAAIWRDLLHVERVSRHDNFFELGGHSLLAVQLVSRLRQALSVEVALSTVFDAPVLSALAERLEAENTEVLPPIPLAPRDGRIALSLAQQRLWFLTQLEGVSEAYHMSGAVRLDGPLNREVLQRALNRIVMRHEALRTCFVREEGEPIQVIQPHADLTVSYHDLREAEQSEQRAKNLSQAHASAPFDLSRDLPVRVLLLQLADEAHVVQVVMHHIASDGWSVGVLLQELSALYGSFIAEQGDPLAPLPLQYADYAAWQRRWLASGQLEKQGAFWQTNLSGAPTLLELPTDRPRPPKQSHAGASVEVKLGAALSERVKRLSQRHGVTPYMTLLSSWAAVLSRLSGQEEVVIGSPVAGRNRTEVEALIGFFVNTLALRLDLSSEPTVGELLKRTKAQVLSAQAHQDLPFDQVVERVKPPRSTAHPPLFQVMFVWQNMPAGELTIPGLTIRAVETPLQTAQFELTLSLQEAGDDIVGHLNYASALFDESTVRRYVTYWRRLLEGMTAGAADQTIVGLPLLDEAERKQMVYAWNATERDYPIEQCIHQLFEAQVDRKPEAIALTFDGQRLSYAELNARANRLAHYLQARGVGPDRLVALCAERGIEMVVGLLAILKAGGAYVPLDPSHPPERLRRMLDDTNPVAVLVDDIGADALASFESHVAARSPRVHLSRDIAQWRACNPANPPTPRERAARRLAYVIYTSGSSGEPKGVMNEHRGVVNRLWWMQQTYALDERDAVLQKTPFSFDVSVWEFFWPLMSGARLVIAKPEGHKDPAYLSELIDRERVTTLHFVPSMLQAFLEDEGAARGCGSVKRVMCSGEALPPSLVKRFYRCLPDARLHNLYGPTEAAVDVTAWACDAEEGGASVPIGRPIANTRIYILDGYGQPVPRGVAGELYIGGVQVARGYLNRPELTRERFVDDPFVAGGRLYKTGDLARWRTDGSLEYLGRNDFQVKIRGFRIELGEIEAQLAKVAGVREAVVLAREAAPDTKRHAASNENSASNSGEKRLVAYYTGDADVVALRAQAAQHLPSYMVPSAYVRLDAWPLTPNGKLDRHALPAPADDAYARAEYEAPQGAKEEALAAIWKDLLPVERISRHDNFFELGGHSLLAITLIEHMRRANLHADVTTLFTAPTLADLAVRVGASRGDTYVPPNLIPGDAANGTPESAEVEELRL
ncbi:syringomycin synthetase [Burkholderia pseudomallei]|nr:syringomycin synthetase [Burkholderia pseudomallei]